MNCQCTGLTVILGSLLTALPAVTAEFPAPFNSEAHTDAKPMPAGEAAAKFGLPPGFKAVVFAAEPDVQNPIALAWDARGRLWIAENYTYAEGGVRYEMKLRDRILVFEDRDGDGRFDSRQVFTDEVQKLTSIEVGHGGVWALTLPQLIFIPDRNGDGVPDGPAEALLDGFYPPQENHHNVANGIRFGPDGWLYGRCGASGPADVGAPGTPAEARIPVRGGMWRYHPQWKVFEAITSGNTNPWGHDWNEHGEIFYVNTVNGHLWHAFAGAHFVRPHTIDPNPHVYEMIDMHADHWHFDTGKTWSGSRGGAANQYGGGHSHIGAMVYLGDNWPEAYRGRLFTLNQHGRRANQEILERRGSGYLARHGEDTLLAADTWFRGLDLSYGPDGGVYVIDWSDTGECHESDGVHRQSGRIYKVTYRDPKRVDAGDLTKLGAGELVSLQTHANEWFARQARLELASRAAGGRGLENAKDRLHELFRRDQDPVHQLRALWSLYVIGAADEEFLRAQLRHPDEHVRTWAVRLLCDRWPLDTTMSRRPGPGVEPNEALRKELVRVARGDPSALVRLALASALQRLPVGHRAELAAALVSHAEDAGDHNLPLLVWYGLIPLAESDPAGLVDVGSRCELPKTRKYVARRLAEDIENNPAPLDRLLGAALTATSPAFASDVLAGVSEALTGVRKARKPEAWDALAKKFGESPDDGLRGRVRELSVVFGDGRALDEVKRVALDDAADLNVRRAALQTLIDNRPPDLRAICEKLLTVRFLNSVAARGLTASDDPAVGAMLVKAYREFHPSERPQLIAALTSRPSFTRALLDAVGEGKLPRGDLTAFHARQIRSLNDAALNAQLAKVWGELRESGADQQQLIARLKQQLTSDELAKADRGNGRAVFAKACANCHRLYGEGGDIGPDLTGAGREDLQYLLENLVDPSAVLPADFRMSVLSLKDGRLLSGLLRPNSRTVTVQTMTEKVTFERSEIANIQESQLSLMPEGLLDSLSPAEVRDLIAYLMQKTQVPLPAGAAQAAGPPAGKTVPAASPAAAGDPPSGEWTAKEDHQHLMAQLGIATLRGGADGMNRQAPNYQNVDESKANPWPNLPDPLRLKNGERVTAAEAWWKKRRPEIVEDFDREVYGRVPKEVPKVAWEVTRVTEETNGAPSSDSQPVVTKALVGRVDNSSCPSITVEIQLTLTTPAGVKDPVPVMMEFGFSFGGFGGGRPGGTGGAGSKGAARPGGAFPPGSPRGDGGGGPGWQRQVLAKGWGYAIITPSSVQADNGSGLRKGIIGLCNRGQPRKPDDWGALRAWAWGASRALDYLETDRAVDVRQVGIEGLSRYGKAALVAMAYDQRFAIGFIGSSGAGGAKLFRRNFGELVENLTGSGEYHWMAGNFLKYGGPLNAGDLPVDAHELIALCAPRPTFISYGASSGQGAEGTWVDQRGSFMAAVAAGPVFRLLGKKDLGTGEFPPVETALIDGELAFRQHGGGHTTGPNWPTFLTFADRYLKGPALPANGGAAGKER